MMGRKAQEFASLPPVSLDELVPPNHFYRHLDRSLDLAFVRDLVRQAYADIGRPSIDPIVFFKLQLTLFFEGLRSERQLMQVVADRLSLRWCLGYDLTEPLPDHSSLTRIRQRLGVDIFQRFFERVVDLCQEAGLVWGREFYIDATKGGTSLGYHDHYVVDDGKRRIILAALATPANVMENVPMRDLLWRVCFRRKIWPRQVTGDTTYGTGENIVALEDAGIRAYVPLPDVGARRP